MWPGRIPYSGIEFRKRFVKQEEPDTDILKRLLTEPQTEDDIIVPQLMLPRMKEEVSDLKTKHRGDGGDEGASNAEGEPTREKMVVKLDGDRLPEGANHSGPPSVCGEQYDSPRDRICRRKRQNIDMGEVAGFVWLRGLYQSHDFYVNRRHEIGFYEKLPCVNLAENGSGD